MSDLWKVSPFKYSGFLLPLTATDFLGICRLDKSIQKWAVNQARPAETCITSSPDEHVNYVLIHIIGVHVCVLV